MLVCDGILRTKKEKKEMILQCTSLPSEYFEPIELIAIDIYFFFSVKAK